jgi:hypothetical protein
MLSLVRADWLRIRRRWDVWFIVLGIPALALLGYVSGALSSGNMQVQTSGDVPPEFQAQMAAQDAAMRAYAALPYQFPHSIVTTLQGATVWLILAAAFLAASMLGNEFGWGTIRNVVLFRPDRSRYLAVRLAWILALLCVTFLAVAALGAILPAIVRVDPGDPSVLQNVDQNGMGFAPFGPTSPVSLGGALLVAGAMLTIPVAGLALAGLAALKFRSAATGMLGAGIYAAAEGIAAALLMSRATGDLRYIPQMALTTRLAALLGDAQQAAGLSSTGGEYSSPGWVALPPAVGAAIVAAWIVGLIALWFVVLRRADINE